MTDRLADVSGRTVNQHSGTNRSGSGHWPADEQAARIMASGRKSALAPVHDAMCSSPCYDQAIDPGFSYTKGQPS